MDLDSRAYSKLIDENNTYGGSEEYIRILDAILPLTKRRDPETPEMWCSHIRDPFRKILEENPRILSKNGYIIMYESFMKMIRSTMVIQPIIFIVMYVTP